MAEDRLLCLGMARGALQWAWIASVEEYRRASRAQFAHFGDHAPLIRRLVARGRPDVLAALFDPPDWHVGGRQGEPAAHPTMTPGPCSRR